ncbi:uncharacterized protein PF3D7_1120000-like [Hydra vulgaris]|uniref:Uncharacterized protein PF3D7_1120000-like n=1 Tax=Hydra vulgaris TaxID=6087 RepID=A0ABM4DI81_HYDVU
MENHTLKLKIRSSLIPEEKIIIIAANITDKDLINEENIDEFRNSDKITIYETGRISKYKIDRTETKYKYVGRDKDEDESEEEVEEEVEKVEEEVKEVEEEVEEVQEEVEDANLR